METTKKEAPTRQSAQSTKTYRTNLRQPAANGKPKRSASDDPRKRSRERERAEVVVPTADELRTVFIPVWLDDAGLSLVEFRIFCRVARCGTCFQSVTHTLTKLCRVNKGKIRNALRSLVKLEMLAKRPCPGYTDEYQLHPRLLGHPAPGRAPYPALGRATKESPIEGYPKQETKGETGVSRHPSPSRSRSFKAVGVETKPRNIEEVLIHALTRDQVCDTRSATALVKRHDFNGDLTAQEILDAETDDEVRYALGWAFRFVHYNNLHAWPLANNWRAAFDGFVARDRGDGASVPRNWSPHINGVDGWPEQESTE